MIFKSLTIRNFLSIEHAELWFNNGVHLVQGVNHDMSSDGWESNGSGKSALCGEAIEWAIWGSLSRTPKVIADSVINKASGKDCFVRVDFLVGGKEWTVIRTRKDSQQGNSLRWWIDDVEMTKHDMNATKDDLVSSLPFSRLVFRHAVQIGQGIPDKFLDLSETEKQNLLCEILGLDVYDNAFESVSNNLRVVEQDEKVVANELESLEENKSSKEGILSSAREELSSLKELLSSFSSSISDRNNSVNSLKNSLFSIKESLSSKRNEHQVLMEEYKSFVDNASGVRKKVDDSIKKAEDEDRIAVLKWEDSKREITNKKSEVWSSFKAQEERVNNFRNRLEQVSGDDPICLTCGQSRIKENIQPIIDSARRDLDSEISKFKEIEATYNKYEESESEFNEKYSTARVEWYEYVKAVRGKGVEDISGYESKSTEMLNRINSVREEENGLLLESRSIEEKINSLVLEVEKISNDRKNLELKVAKSEERVSLYSSELELTNSQIDTLRPKLDSVKKEREHWSYWKVSIPNLRASAMDQVLTFVNSRIEEYLGEFSSGIMGMNIYQTPHGKKSRIKTDLRTPGGTYEMSSGGERRRIDLSIYLALSDLLHAASGVSCNVLVADEIMDSLSPEGVKKFSDILRKKADQGMCVFIISHNPSVKQIISYDSVITVERKDGKSKVKEERMVLA